MAVDLSLKGGHGAASKDSFKTERSSDQASECMSFKAEDVMRKVQGENVPPDNSELPADGRTGVPISEERRVQGAGRSGSVIRESDYSESVVCGL
ncbi:MAG: hypothetical protein RL215_1142 [Planctomycetota bacterium]|jgi:hypothetical protein